MVETKDIHKSYGELQVLKGINLRVNKGEVVAIVGVSGAGKSTLLHIIGTLDKADEGSVIIDGNDVGTSSPKKLAKFRNSHIGFIFQFHHLLPEFNALENVCIPAYIGGISKDEAEAKAMLLLAQLGVDNRATHKPGELSGGEQQRVAVARALINNPYIVLADEPSGNLDSKNADELHDLFFKLRKDLDQTFIIVTHNEALANKADRKVTMKDGLIMSN